MTLDLLVKLVVVGLIAAVCWAAVRSRDVFVVRIRAGEARVTRGRVPVGFVQRIAEACQRSGVQRGWVRGVQRGRRIALAFSRSIPRGCQQQLRNEWLVSG